MPDNERTTTKEKLIDFIHNLTDEECKRIILSLNKIQKEQP